MNLADIIQQVKCAVAEACRNCIYPKNQYCKKCHVWKLKEMLKKLDGDDNV
jgi:hypothetical protein